MIILNASGFISNISNLEKIFKAIEDAEKQRIEKEKNHLKED